ncbi:hypothetical protein TgHK011_007279 [Trichoderma gracile]|nr:hypothetical protein TgHK011_007279 [Trichoderma gracile]
MHGEPIWTRTRTIVRFQTSILVHRQAEPKSTSLSASVMSNAGCDPPVSPEVTTICADEQAVNHLQERISHYPDVPTAQKCRDLFYQPRSLVRSRAYSTVTGNRGACRDSESCLTGMDQADVGDCYRRCSIQMSSVVL